MPFWVIFGHFGPFLGHFVACLDKFAESSNFFVAPFGVEGLASRMYGLSQNPTGSNNPPFLCTGFSNISAFFF